MEAALPSNRLTRLPSIAGVGSPLEVQGGSKPLQAEGLTPILREPAKLKSTVPSR